MKYRKYKNVEMTDKFYPFLGDLKPIMEYQKSNIFVFYDYIKCALEKPEKDLKLVQLATFSCISAISPRAREEFERLIPTKIDRYHCKLFPMGYGLAGSLPLIPSTENWKDRRTTFMKMIGLNSISSYVPMMIQTTDEVMNKWKINERIDISNTVKTISFTVICKIMFGRDSFDNETLVDYCDLKTDKIVKMPFEEMLFKWIEDTLNLTVHPLGFVFPFLKKYPIVQPYKGTVINAKTIKMSLRKFCDDSKDEGSVFNRLVALNKFDREDIYNDILGFLLTGMDTTADGIASILYFLKKNPRVMDKLKDELKIAGLDYLSGKNLTKEQLDGIHPRVQNCDYLSYVFKEMLRLDSPGMWSIKYEAKENIKI